MVVIRCYMKNPGDKKAQAFADLPLHHGLDGHAVADFFAMCKETIWDMGALVRFKEVRLA